MQQPNIDIDDLPKNGVIHLVIDQNFEHPHWGFWTLPGFVDDSGLVLNNTPSTMEGWRGKIQFSIRDITITPNKNVEEDALVNFNYVSSLSSDELQSLKTTNDQLDEKFSQAVLDFVIGILTDIAKKNGYKDQSS